MSEMNGNGRPITEDYQAEMAEAFEAENAELRERLAALELALESVDWRLLSAQAEHEFSREGLRTITELSRVMYLKNPLVQRGVNVKRFYVWGQGVSTKAAEPAIGEVIRAFEADQKNVASLTGHQARMTLETELQTDGNLFFVFFVSRSTGRVRVRTIPFEEIDEVICNPEDSKEPWYYVRRWTQQSLMADGQIQSEAKTAIYPDWRYNPTAKPNSLRGYEVHWETPIYHVRVGGFSNWKFGISEIYDTIDWARAYKEFLEDWSSIVRAYRRFAFQLSTPGGRRGISAAKSKLQTTYGSSGGTGAETNPAPSVGSTFIASEGVQLQAVRTSGATVSAEDGRRLLLMVAASIGLPETFFGDVSVGTLATAKSLDRPTELAMMDRRTLWTSVLRNIYEFVLLWAVKAGELRGVGRIERQIEDGQIEERVRWNEDVDATVAITWPPLIEKDVGERVDAIVKAGTLGGPSLAGTIDLPTLARMLLVTLGVEDVDEIVERLFPDGAEDGGQTPERSQAEAAMVEALRDLRAVLASSEDDGHG